MAPGSISSARGTRRLDKIDDNTELGAFKFPNLT